jgi:hypothetical protein
MGNLQVYIFTEPSTDLFTTLEGGIWFCLVPANTTTEKVWIKSQN